MGVAVARARRFPFREHRTMAQVLETEELERLRAKGDSYGPNARRLQSLQSRAVMPEYDDPPPTRA
jgi:hypothetical protein